MDFTCAMGWIGLSWEGNGLGWFSCNPWIREWFVESSRAPYPCQHSSTLASASSPCAATATVAVAASPPYRKITGRRCSISQMNLELFTSEDMFGRTHEGRILGDTRSSLTSEMLEALDCGKDWLFIEKDVSMDNQVEGSVELEGP